MSTAAYVALVYRNFKAYGPDMYSHVGLGVNAYHTAKVLMRHGIQAKPLSVWSADNVIKRLAEHPYTHAVIDALWLNRADLVRIAERFPSIQFFVRCHSQIGFLQVEPGAVKILREDLSLQESELNVHVAGNSHRFVNFIRNVYNQDCALLPNLYDLDRVSPRAPRNIHRKIRVASFGSIRHLKLHSVAAAGALWLARSKGKDLEFHLSVHREEHGSGALQAIRNLFESLPWAQLIENPWQDWGDFRRLVAHMDLCIQVSATETFNLATADAIAEGVPCVVSTAIEWTPEDWQVDTDDAEKIARIGWRLVSDPDAPREGHQALERYQHSAIRHWKHVLGHPD
jgi:hypothetical protein